MFVKSKTFIASAFAALIFASVATAATKPLGETVLSKSIASTARISEGKATEPAAIRAKVQADVEELIVRAAPSPARVLIAIDSVFAACRPTDGSNPLLDWSCPATEDAYSALMALRGTIQALLESPGPGSTDTPGDPALSSFPTTNAGGVNYRSI
jgi:hypothetical protein